MLVLSNVEWSQFQNLMSKTAKKQNDEKMAIQAENPASGPLAALIKHCPAGEINIAVFMECC